MTPLHGFFVPQVSGYFGSAKPCLPQSKPVTNRRESSHLPILVYCQHCIFLDLVSTLLSLEFNTKPDKICVYQPWASQDDVRSHIKLSHISTIVFGQLASLLFYLISLSCIKFTNA